MAWVAFCAEGKLDDRDTKSRTLAESATVELEWGQGFTPLTAAEIAPLILCSWGPAITNGGPPGSEFNSASSLSALDKDATEQNRNVQSLWFNGVLLKCKWRNWTISLCHSPGFYTSSPPRLSLSGSTCFTKSGGLRHRETIGQAANSVSLPILPGSYWALPSYDGKYYDWKRPRLVKALEEMQSDRHDSLHWRYKFAVCGCNEECCRISGPNIDRKAIEIRRFPSQWPGRGSGRETSTVMTLTVQAFAFHVNTKGIVHSVYKLCTITTKYKHYPNHVILHFQWFWSKKKAYIRDLKSMPIAWSPVWKHDSLSLKPTKQIAIHGFLCQRCGSS